MASANAKMRLWTRPQKKQNPHLTGKARREQEIANLQRIAFRSPNQEKRLQQLIALQSKE